MRNIIFKKSIPFLVVLGLFFTLSATAAPPAQDEEKRAAPIFISADFQDAKLKNVLKILSQQSGLNFIASEAVKAKRVTLYLDNVSVQDTLDSIINANGLTYEQAPGSDIFIVKEPALVLVETITRVFRLDYAPVYPVEQGSESEEESEEYYSVEESEGAAEGDIVSLVRQLLTKEVTGSETGETTTQYLGSVAIDARTNSIIVTDTPAKLKIIEETIAKLDVPVPQVMIEVEVIETSLNTLEELGLEWGDSGEIFAINLASADLIFPFQHIYKDSLIGWPANSAAGDSMVVEGYKGVYPGKLDNAGLRVALDLLVTEKKVKILARPKILALNNVTAEININSNDAIQITREWIQRGTGEWSEEITPERAPKDERPGVTLIVTPTINQDNVIKMVIEPKVISKVISDMSTDASPIYDLHFRTAKTTVMVNDGETVIIGGLISKVKEHTLKKTPFLGDIPILGNFFRHKDTNDEDVEIVFFITPYIVNRGAVFSRSFSDSDQSGLSGSASGGAGELENASGLPQSPSESGEIEKGGNAKLKKLTGDIKKELEIQQAIEKFSLK